MTISPETVRLWNEAHARLGLTEARTVELTIELEQFRRVAEAMRQRVTFDMDPADFRSVLLTYAPGSQ